MAVGMSIVRAQRTDSDGSLNSTGCYLDLQISLSLSDYWDSSSTADIWLKVRNESFDSDIYEYNEDLESDYLEDDAVWAISKLLVSQMVSSYTYMVYVGVDIYDSNGNIAKSVQDYAEIAANDSSSITANGSSTDIDWTASMKQTFEFYKVNADSWQDTEKLELVTSATIDWDADADTLGSATIDMDEVIGECYIRIYLIAEQGNVRRRIVLGTFLAQPPEDEFDGYVVSVSMDAYTPLIELKEKYPPYGYTIEEGSNIMNMAYRLVCENIRAPVVEPNCDTEIYTDFTADTDDTWVSYLTDFMSYAEYGFALDERCRVLFAPIQDLKSMQPVWTYTDDNSSILKPKIKRKHDLYDVPNVVEVIYSDSGVYYESRIVNDAVDSETSTIARGREIPYRETSPSISGSPSQEIIDLYAEELLRELSSVEYELTYYHGYCPVRVGDCVRMDYKLSGITGINAKVTSQSITCETGCEVTETAVYTVKYWE